MEPAPELPEELRPHFLAIQDGVWHWLLYRPDIDWLQSPEAALTLSLAEAFCALAPQATHRVFSPVKYVGSALLRERGLKIEHAPIPQMLFRIGGL